MTISRILRSIVSDGLSIFPRPRQYAQARDADLTSAKLIHYSTPTKLYNQADFEWSFTNTNFVIRCHLSPIPGAIVDRCLPKICAASRITGKWTIKDGKGQWLVLTGIRVEKYDVPVEVKFPIFKIAPRIIRIGKSDQYVFLIGR